MIVRTADPHAARSAAALARVRAAQAAEADRLLRMAGCLPDLVLVAAYLGVDGLLMARQAALAQGWTVREALARMPAIAPGGRLAPRSDALPDSWCARWIPPPELTAAHRWPLPEDAP